MNKTLARKGMHFWNNYIVVIVFTDNELGNGTQSSSVGLWLPQKCIYLAHLRDNVLEPKYSEMEMLSE